MSSGLRSRSRSDRSRTFHSRAGGDPTVDRWVDLALRNSRRLLRLVNQLLDVAKLDAGAMTLEHAGSTSRRSPAASSARSPRSPNSEGIHLTNVVPDALPGAFDHDALEKVLTNLLSNAIKFTPDGGAVDVRLSQENGAARWRVSNTGPGIPPDKLAHVFERFYRADESKARSQPGTGIGLSLVKELLELHGGQITVESTDSGTTFTATIPIVVGDAPAVRECRRRRDQRHHARYHGRACERSTPERTEAHGEDVPTLLVVDDSADLRVYIRDHFAPRFRVLEAEDGAEGIELARRHLPDVIVSDVMMPGTDGYELVRVLRESPETDFLTVILLTARADEENRLAGLEHGADEYLIKPFAMRELDVRVRNLISARQRLRERFAGGRIDELSGGKSVVDAPPPSPTLAAADVTYATRVQETIRRRLSDPDFGVAELADAVSQDRTHLFRRLREVFGESPSDLIRRMRLEEGARLLRTDAATVTDVAYAVGFNSLSHFCLRFQDVYGITPAAYRERETAQRR